MDLRRDEFEFSPVTGGLNPKPYLHDRLADESLTDAENLSDTDVELLRLSLLYPDAAPSVCEGDLRLMNAEEKSHRLQSLRMRLGIDNDPTASS